MKLAHLSTIIPIAAIPILCFGLPVIAQAQGSNWIPLMTAKGSRGSMFVDKSSIRKQGQIVNFQTLYVINKSSTEGVSSFLFNISGNCRTLQAVTTKTTALDAQANVIYTEQGGPKAQSGSATHIAVETICKLY